MKITKQDNRKQWLVVAAGIVILILGVIVFMCVHTMKAKASNVNETAKLTVSENYKRQVADYIYNDVMERLDDAALAEIGQKAVVAYLNEHQLPVSKQEKEQLLQLLIREFEADGAHSKTKFFTEDQKRELAESVQDTLNDSLDQIEISSSESKDGKKEKTALSEKQLEKLKRELEANMESKIAASSKFTGTTVETRVVKGELTKEDWERITQVVNQSMSKEKKIQADALAKALPKKGVDYFTQSEVKQLQKTIANQVFGKTEKQLKKLTKQIDLVNEKNEDLNKRIIKLTNLVDTLDQTSQKNEEKQSWEEKDVSDSLANGSGYEQVAATQEVAVQTKKLQNEMDFVQQEMSTLATETKNLAKKISIDGKSVTVIGMDGNALTRKKVWNTGMSVAEYLQLLSTNDSLFADSVQKLNEMLPKIQEKTGQSYLELEKELKQQIGLWKKSQDQLEQKIDSNADDVKGVKQSLLEWNEYLEKKINVQAQQLTVLSKQVNELKERSAQTSPGSSTGGEPEPGSAPGTGGDSEPGPGTGGDPEPGPGTGGDPEPGPAPGTGGDTESGENAGDSSTGSSGETATSDSKLPGLPKIKVLDTNSGELTVQVEAPSDDSNKPFKYNVYAIRQDHLEHFADGQMKPSDIKEYGARVAQIKENASDKTCIITGLDKNAYYYVCVTSVTEDEKENTALDNQTALYCLDTTDTSGYVYRKQALEQMNWEQIQQIGASGKASEYFRVGDTKMILNGKYQIRIIGFNQDELSSNDLHYMDAHYNDRGQHAAYTFQFASSVKEIGDYKLEKIFYQNKNKGKEDSDSWYGFYYQTPAGVSPLARYSYNEKIAEQSNITYADMSAAVQTGVGLLKEGGMTEPRKVKKSYGFYHEPSNNLLQLETQMFALSEQEISGKQVYAAVSEGMQYPYYQNGGQAPDGWLRSGSKNRESGKKMYYSMYSYTEDGKTPSSDLITGYAYGLCKVHNNIVEESFEDTLSFAPAFCY